MLVGFVRVNLALPQGDQIGRIFTCWVIVGFGQLFWKLQKFSEFRATLFNGKSSVLVMTKRVGLHFGRYFHKPIWGRCYDHNFLRFLTIFGEKVAFFSKTNVMINILHKLALFWVKNANFFAEFFGENILKIITSVPGHAAMPTPCSNLSTELRADREGTASDRGRQKNGVQASEKNLQCEFGP
jgi:hypothetical protein